MKKLSFVGIGGATNIELGGNSCYLKENDTLLIIDACEGLTEKLLKSKAFNNIKNIYIILTHTHFDHIAGLGVFIWYSNFYLKIIPNIIYSKKSYLKHLKKLLKITGVDKEYINFIKDKDFKMNDLSITLKKTKHTKKLDCFGIMFEDNNGKYYYTGDTFDINYIKELSLDDNVKKIYTEVANETYNVHIKYEDIKDLNKDKLVLMHFDTVELYERSIKEGFNVANKKSN